jgi:hypothetical protein
VIWAAWHLPLFFLPGTDSEGRSFFVYLLHVTAISVALGWLYWRSSGSLLLPMLMHAAINNTGGLVPASLPYRVAVFSFDASRVAWISVAVAWGMAAVLLVDMRRASTRAMDDAR